MTETIETKTFQEQLTERINQLTVFGQKEALEAAKDAVQEYFEKLKKDPECQELIAFISDLDLENIILALFGQLKSRLQDSIDMAEAMMDIASEHLEEMSEKSQEVVKNNMIRGANEEVPSLFTIKRIELLANRHPLTELPNKKVDIEIVNQKIRNSDLNWANTIGDGDKFGGINELFGLDVGDKFIQNFARGIQEVIRDNDLLCHIGGDEFQVISLGVQNREDAFIAIQKIVDHLADRPFTIEVNKETVNRMQEQWRKYHRFMPGHQGSEPTVIQTQTEEIQSDTAGAVESTQEDYISDVQVSNIVHFKKILEEYCANSPDVEMNNITKEQVAFILADHCLQALRPSKRKAGGPKWLLTYTATASFGTAIFNPDSFSEDESVKDKSEHFSAIIEKAETRAKQGRGKMVYVDYQGEGMKFFELKNGRTSEIE